MSAAVRDLQTHATADVVVSAARVLAAGGLVAFPTETVYGLGARADDDAAVASVFAAKGRPADHPLIVHVASAVQAEIFAAELPPTARRLMEAFWPGPVTLVVRRAPCRAVAAAGGHPTLGLRCPAHPVARALLEAALRLGVPGLAAPSANRFGRISPTLAHHVRDEFGEQFPVLDGGSCEIGIESAIVDCSTAVPMLLRPGAVSRQQIEAAIGLPLASAQTPSSPAPGTLASHYAPRTRLRLLPMQAIEAALQTLVVDPGRVAVYSRTVPRLPIAPRGRTILLRAMPEDAVAAGHELFASLRELDALGLDGIWVERPPESPEWEGVRDRLERAAS